MFEMNSDPASLPGVPCPINFLCSLQAESRIGTAGTFQVSNIYSLAANSSSHWNSYPHFNLQFKLRPLENIPPKVSFSEWRRTLSFAGSDLVPHTSFFGKPACVWYVLLAATQMEMFWEENLTLRFLCTFSVSSQHWIIIIYGIYFDGLDGDTTFSYCDSSRMCLNIFTPGPCLPCAPPGLASPTRYHEWFWFGGSI